MFFEWETERSLVQLLFFCQWSCIHILTVIFMFVQVNAKHAKIVLRVRRIMYYF